MHTQRRRLSLRSPAWLIAATALALPGCGPSGSATHAVKGVVELPGSQPALLAGHSVEVALVADPTVRAYGEIKPDGSFALETLDEGVVRRGAKAGQYQVRLVLSDDEPEKLRQAAQTLDPRFLQFDTSGLSLQVPASAAVALRVSAPQNPVTR